MPEGPSPELSARVDALRGEARALLAQQAELYWRNWVYGDAIDVAATYRGHERLFSRPSVDLVEKLASELRDPVRRRALEFFRIYLVGEAIGRAVAPLSDQVANLEVESTVSMPGGGEQPYRELNRLLGNEVNYQLRGQIADAADPVLRKLNPLLQKKEELTRQVLAEMGWPSYAAFGTALREADLGALGRLAEQVLEGTDGIYRSGMDREARQDLGVGIGALRRADIPRLDRATAVDAHFPADRLVPTLKATLAGLGIDLDAQHDIRIDDAPLPRKNPRAVCFPIVVPTDIRLSVKPLGGVGDYEALFHESGHAEHYAHTRTPYFEFQQLGDAAPTEAYAFVLEDLVENPLWLRERVGLSGRALDSFVYGAAVRKLYLLRRYAGKLLYELAWHGGAKDPRAVYRQTLARAYGFPLSEADADRWLVDHDDFFYSADYLRAWFLAAQIEQSLVRRFGPTWWERPDAGRALVDLWRHGNELSVDEIARAVGAPGLSTEPLLAHFHEVLAPQPAAAR